AAGCAAVRVSNQVITLRGKAVATIRPGHGGRVTGQDRIAEREVGRASIETPATAGGVIAADRHVGQRVRAAADTASAPGPVPAGGSVGEGRRPLVVQAAT